MRGLAALLVLAVVPGHGAVRRLGLDRVAIRGEQHRGHQAERAEALRHDVGLHVAVVVLAGPDIAAFPLQGGGDHVVDQPVLVDQAGRLELVGEFGVEDGLEDVLEVAVIGLEDRVLVAEVHAVAARQAVVQAGAGEALDAGVEVVHRPSTHAGALEVEVAELDRAAAVGRGEGHGHLAGAGDLHLDRAVDVAIGMAADDDRLRPVRHQARHVAADDRLAEDRAVEDVADRAVRAAPHLLQAEFGDARLIRGDGRAFHADAILLDGIGGIDGHLVVGLVAVLDAQVVVFQVHIQVGEDELLLDEPPDDAGHLVSVELDDGGLYLDLCHAGPRGLPPPGAAEALRGRGGWFWGGRNIAPGTPVGKGWPACRNMAECCDIDTLAGSGSP